MPKDSRETDLRLPPELEKVREVQDRQYDPGYWLGGNIHPLIRSRRPNRYGYVLFVPVVVLLASVAQTVRDQGWGAALAPLAVAVFFSAVAMKLLRGSQPKQPDPASDDEVDEDGDGEPQ